MKRTQITWVDSCGPPDIWNPVEVILEIRVVRVKSAGWVLHENKKQITLAGTIASNGQVGGIIIIPKVAIRKRKDY